MLNLGTNRFSYVKEQREDNIRQKLVQNTMFYASEVFGFLFTSKQASENVNCFGIY